jgi:hypothetical protein
MNKDEFGLQVVCPNRAAASSSSLDSACSPRCARSPSSAPSMVRAPGCAPMPPAAGPPDWFESLQELQTYFQAPRLPQLYAAPQIPYSQPRAKPSGRLLVCHDFKVSSVAINTRGDGDGRVLLREATVRKRKSEATASHGGACVIHLSSELALCALTTCS